MKTITLFRTKQEYEEFVFSRAFRAPLISGHPFYRRLIQWVIDNRTPVFFEQSDPLEHDSFSLYWHWILLRRTYANPVHESMYLLHEFVHSLFRYPHDLLSAGYRGFFDACVQAEYAASNETEVLAHYRIPELRTLFLRGMRIWYDVLRDGGRSTSPSVPEMLALRRDIIEGRTPVSQAPPADRPVLESMRHYEELNERWATNHWPLWSAMPTPEAHGWPFLDPETYEDVVASYERSGGQAEYEANVLANVRTLFILHGMGAAAPTTFAECFEKRGLLEGRVLPGVHYRT